MKRFVQFNVHYYMDLRPIKEVRIMEVENINIFLEGTKEWTGGTVTLNKIFTESQARSYVNSIIAKEESNWQSDSQQFIDQGKKFFEEAYGVAF